MRRGLARGSLIAALLAMLLSAACRNDPPYQEVPLAPPSSTPSVPDPGIPGPPQPIIDGVFHEWDASTLLLRDPADDANGGFDVTELHATSRGSQLFLKFDTGRVLNLASGADADGTLILTIQLEDGRELEVDFRAREFRLQSQGTISGYGLGYVASPTHAGEAFELKLDLDNLGVQPGSTISLAMEGSDALGPVDFEFEYASAQQVVGDALRPPNSRLRVASLNTERAGFFDLDRRDAIGRLLRAAAADVVILQELGQAPNATIAFQLEQSDPSERGGAWNVVSKGAGDIIGNAVASRHAIVGIPTPSPRFVGAVVQLHDPGPVAVFGVHLKCCGYAGSDEDDTRLAEAAMLMQTIDKLRNGQLGQALLPFTDVPVVVAGDFNDVGSPDLQQRLLSARQGASGLKHLRLPHLAGSDRFTWYRQGAGFPPGVLDLVFHSSDLEAVHQFILDSRQLDVPALEALGLTSYDSNASDHLLLVADFAPAPSL